MLWSLGDLHIITLVFYVVTFIWCFSFAEYALVKIILQVLTVNLQMPGTAENPINLLKPTGYVMHWQVQHSTTVRSAHTAFMCFVFISEETATCATYSINWLVFITEMKSVYSAVRTGPLNKVVCASSLKG